MIAQAKILFVLSGCLLTGALAATDSAPAVPAVAQAKTDLAAKALVEKACTDCHKFDMVSTQRKTADQWKANVARMIEIGAPVSSAEAPRVVAYLARHYGPVGGR